VKVKIIVIIIKKLVFSMWFVMFFNSDHLTIFFLVEHDNREQGQQYPKCAFS